MATRYEILPFGGGESEAATARCPLVVTVTCSPRQGLDRTIDVASRVANGGKCAVAHLAARMIRDAGHLDAALRRLADSGVDDVFVIAGDSHEPCGPYASAVELLPVVASHSHRPERIGIAAYPEGHPLIDGRTLDEALSHKARLADYMVTQLCFDSEALLDWIERTRRAGIDLPLYVGLPGVVDRRRLLEISVRAGVGTSIAFLRKQRGIGRLLGRPEHAVEYLHKRIAPRVGDAELGIAGLHFFTFNRLAATLAWEATRSPSAHLRAGETEDG